MGLAESDTSSQLCPFPKACVPKAVLCYHPRAPPWPRRLPGVKGLSGLRDKTWERHRFFLQMYLQIVAAGNTAPQPALLLSAEADDLHSRALRACGWEPVANTGRRTALPCSSVLLGELKQSHKFTLKLQGVAVWLSSRAWTGNDLDASQFLTAILLWVAPTHHGRDPPLHILGPLWSSSAYYCVPAKRICRDEADAISMGKAECLGVDSGVKCYSFFSVCDHFFCAGSLSS